MKGREKEERERERANKIEVLVETHTCTVQHTCSVCNGNASPSSGTITGHQSLQSSGTCSSMST